jgi:hypothetical protein
MVLGEHQPRLGPDSRLGLAWPAVTHSGWVGGSPKPGRPKTKKGKKKKKKKKGAACVRERAVGVNLVFCSHFLKMQ